MCVNMRGVAYVYVYVADLVYVCMCMRVVVYVCMRYTNVCTCVIYECVPRKTSKIRLYVACVYPWRQRLHG